MPWYGYVLTSIGAGAVLGFWGWVAAKIVHLETELGKLKQWTETKEGECAKRFGWLERMDQKLDTVCENTKEIKGYLRGKESEG